MVQQASPDIQHRTFNFGVDIVKLLNNLPRTIAGREIGRQMLRSGTSIAANMEEAQGAESKRDFIHKVRIAYKEARETRMWLAMIHAAILPNNDAISKLHQESDELVRILYTIIKNTRANQSRPQPKSRPH